MSWPGYFDRMAVLARDMVLAEGSINMALGISHEKIDDIPEQYRDLYTEQDGVFVLTGIQGIKTQADIDRVMSGLTKERDEHKETKTKLHAWDGLEAPEVRSKMDRFTELEVMAKGNKDEFDAKLEELTEARVVSRLAPVERENKTLKTRCDELEQLATGLKVEKTRRVITDHVREACVKSKVEPTAMPDVLMLASQVFEVDETGKLVLTKENPYGVTPGLAPDVFLSEMQDKRPHWWPKAVGGGAGGSANTFGAGGTNPWSADGWNMTRQGAYLKEHGKEKAEQMAKAAGTTLGGMKPAPKK